MLSGTETSLQSLQLLDRWTGSPPPQGLAAAHCSPASSRNLINPSAPRSGKPSLKNCAHRVKMRANNSFKPNLLRSTKAMTEKACHGFGSTKQVGLTQALGCSSQSSRNRGLHRSEEHTSEL